MKSNEKTSIIEVRMLFGICPYRHFLSSKKDKDVIVRILLDSFVVNSVVDMLYSEKEV